MITFIIGLLIIAGSAIGLVCAITMKPARSTPGRRTRGIARWWARCWRWARRLNPKPRREPATSSLQPIPWVSMTGTPAGWNHKPTPEEFAAAPPLDKATCDRLLADLNDPPKFSRGGLLN